MSKAAGLLFFFLILGFVYLLNNPFKQAKAQQAPVPNPPTSNYLIGAFYMPAWRADQSHISWISLDHVPERKPLQGYYDDNSPAAMDWQIKWALEHGINFFIFDWYRCTGNDVLYFNLWPCSASFGRAADEAHTALGSALHQGFFGSRFQDRMNFTIMPTVHLSWNSLTDLENNLLPFWINRYFKRPNYLKVDGKPVLFLYGIEDIERVGGTAAITSIRSKVQQAGFPGIIILGEANSYTLRDLTEETRAKNLGLDYIFQYNNYPWIADGVKRPRPTETEAIRAQIQAYQYLLSNTPIPFVMAANPMWDRYYMAYNKYSNPSEPYFHISAVNYQQVLNNLELIAQQLPANQLGKKMILVNAWNEFLEGHYIAPTVQYGFDYLKSIRWALTNRDNSPSYSLPSQSEINSFSGLYNSYASHIKPISTISNSNLTIDPNTKFLEITDYGFSFESASKISVGGWFKPTTLVNNTPLIYKYSTLNLLAHANGSGQCSIATTQNSWRSPGTSVIWPAGKVIPNTWSHIVCVYDGSSLKVYINGTLSATSTGNVSGNLTNSFFNLYLGNNTKIGDPLFTGEAANIVVKNITLNPTEILNLYGRKPVGFGNSPTATPAFTAVPTSATSAGDINRDGLVNIIDVGIVTDNYGRIPLLNLLADINRDGTANIIDIGIIIDNYSI
jgi:hypothetical protein